MTKKVKSSVLVCLFLYMATVTAFAQTTKQNVLFIAIDDLNDYVSLLQNYPGIKTPNLDRFAKTALTFTKAYCAAPVCNPSRAAILSGIAPYRTGVYDNENNIQGSKLILSAAFLPEHFKANGYTTITRGKIFHTVPDEARYKAMWDEDGGKGDYGPYPSERNVPATIRAPVNFNYQPWDGADTSHPDNVTADFIIEQLNKNHDKPFFMACGFYKPHNPWTAPRRFFDMYPLENIELPKVLDTDWNDLPPLAKNWASNPVDFEALKKSGKWKAVVRSYLACISFMDYNLGRVLDALDKSSYRNNTIVCVFGDNGFHLGEKQHFAKYALWEQTTHILHMWRVPGLTTPGKVCSRTVNLINIFPTLIELCKLDKPRQQLDGRSIVKLLKDPTAPWAYPSITTYKEGNQSIRTEQYRYIHYIDGGEELYDDDADPLEWHNIASTPEMKSLILSLRKQLEIKYVPAVLSKNNQHD